MKLLSKIVLCSLLTGSCATFKSTAEEGANIALKRLGDITSMTLWKNEISFDVDSVLRENVKYLYLSKDQYKEVLAQSYHGKAEDYDKNTGMPNGEFIDFDNELMAQITEEGNLNISTDFILYNNSGVVMKNFEGFSKVYTLSPAKEEYKINIKDNGTGNWETKTDMVTRHYIIRESDDVLLMINLNKSPVGNIYSFGYSSLEEAVKNISESSVYTK